MHQWVPALNMKTLKWRQRLREEFKMSRCVPAVTTSWRECEAAAAHFTKPSSWSISFRPPITDSGALVCGCNLGPLARQPLSSGSAAPVLMSRGEVARHWPAGFVGQQLPESERGSQTERNRVDGIITLSHIYRSVSLKQQSRPRFHRYDWFFCHNFVSRWSQLAEPRLILVAAKEEVN